MTRFSVQRYRAAVLRMYLRIAVSLALPLSALYYLMDETPDRGLATLLFAVFALWLRWRTRHDSEESLYYVNWFVLAMLCLMLYGTYNSSEQLRQEVWMMMFPIVFAPVVAARERIVWAVVGAVAIIAVMLLRPEAPTPLTVLIQVIAYLTLSFITMMLVRHNEQNIERLAHLTIIDPLTKVFCRGYLNEVLTGEINRCRRLGQPLTLLMLDIDHFKMINDDYGHLCGDNVLEQVAAALKHAAKRAGDHVFRYGGEEFCILTSGLDRDGAWRLAEKLRLGVSKLGIECARSPHRHLTASVGFWCVSDLREITPTALLLNADSALYRAKAAGRNTVVDFDSIPAGDEGDGRAVVVTS